MELSDSLYSQLFKVLLIGNSGVGKSSIILRFVDEPFEPAQGPTIGVDFKYKIVERNEKKYKIALWDTAGQDRFRSLTSAFYRGSHGIVLVYDCTDHQSFDDLKFWLEEASRECNNPNAVKILLSNKTDMEKHNVSNHLAVDFARKHGMLFLQASAKTRSGIDDCFNELIYRMIESSNKNENIDIFNFHKGYVKQEPKKENCC